MSETFTAREMGVWKLTAAGMSTKEIAAQIGIARSGVSSVRSTLYHKLHLHSVAQVTLAAVAHGVIPVPEVRPTPVVLPRGHRPFDGGNLFARKRSRRACN